jgi:hypothetical protein
MPSGAEADIGAQARRWWGMIGRVLGAHASRPWGSGAWPHR